MVKVKDTLFCVKNLKKKRRKEPQNFDLREWRFIPQIFTNFLPHDLIFMEIEEPEIKSKQASKRDRTLAQFIYDGIFSHCKKTPIDQMGKNIWGKLMTSFAIGSIYLNGTNYHNLLLHYKENLWGKLMGEIYGENLWGKFMGKINGEN